MNADSLIGTLVHRFNRHVMSFPEPTGPVELPRRERDEPLLLYLHIPFCVSLCPFCTFHRVLFDEQRANAYFATLGREVQLATDAGYRFDEVYVGGGTPTVLPEALVGLLRELRERNPLTTVSVETNPNHLDDRHVGLLHDAGVNRLSVGVQSFDDGLLERMGRLVPYGSGRDIAARLSRYRDAFDTLNVDMIFNQPQQSEQSLRRDLDILVDEVQAAQVSFYPLMVADSTRAAIREHMGTVIRDHEKRYYDLIGERMLAAGYRRDSGWCFSRRGGALDEYIVRRGEYLGLGSGAYSYLGGRIFASTFDLGEYAARVADGRVAFVRERALSRHEQMRYYLLVTMFAGRLDKRRAEALFDGEFAHTLGFELAGLRAIRALRDTGDEWQLTRHGYYLWVVLMREFFTGINSLRDQLRTRDTQARAAI